MSMTAGDLETGVAEIYDLQSRIEDDARRLCPRAFGDGPVCAVQVRIAGEFWIPEAVKVHGARGDLVVRIEEFRAGPAASNDRPGHLMCYFTWEGDGSLAFWDGEKADHVLQYSVRHAVDLFPSVTRTAIERAREDEEWA